MQETSLEDSSTHDLIDELVDEFLSRKLAGESPSISEYCEKYPDLQGRIRDLFPTLDLFENAKPGLRSSGDREPLPSQIAEYRIERVIGRGGMGIVYEAVHESLGRRVALKVVNRSFSNDAKTLARFERESRAIAKLHHTNIVPLFEVGKDDDRLFLAMQLIEGRGLEKVISELRASDSNPGRRSGVSKARSADRQIPLSHGSSLGLAGSQFTSGSGTEARRHFHWITEIGVQVAEALAYAHERGVIHRDIKPSNLLLDNSGIVWLSDFGLAKTEEDDLTQTGEFVGTLRYMAPEQLHGNVDERADVYSLGVTLYELLARQPAYSGSDRLKLLAAIRDTDPLRLRATNPHIPRDFETIVMKAMEKEPASRYQSAMALATDLRRFLNDEPILARRINPIERLIRLSRRNKSLAAALSSVALLLVALVAVLGWTSIHEAELRRLSDARSAELQSNLYLSEMNVAGQAALQPHGIDTIRERVKHWKPDVVGRDLRHWEWYYLYSMAHRASFVSERLGNRFCWSCDHSPDGERIVHTVNGWGIHVRDAKSGAILAKEFLGSARSVDWSPDGKLIAVGHFDGKCRILDAETLDRVSVIIIPNSIAVRCVKWHPNSRWLAEVSHCGTVEMATGVRIIDTQTGKLLRQLQGHSGDVFHLAWSPDGKQLASSDNQEVIVWNQSDGQIVLRTDGANVNWSPDGTLACVRASGIWDVFENEQIVPAENVDGIAWRPDSKQLALGCRDGKIQVYDVDSSRLLCEFLGHTSEIWSLSWSKGGGILATCGLRDETVRFWDMNENHFVRAIGDPRNSIQIEVSDTDDYIIGFVIYGGVVMVWDKSGELLSNHDFGYEIRDIAVSADGKQIAVCALADTINIWNTKNDAITELTVEGQIHALDWNASGMLAAGLDSGDIMIWDSLDKTVGWLKDAHESAVFCVDWSATGDLLASAGGGSILKLWDTATNSLMWQTETQNSFPREIGFSHNGEFLAAAFSNALAIWNVSSGERIRQMDDIQEDFRSLDWSPDDQRLVSGSRSNIALWEVASGKVALRLERLADLHSVRWSSDGTRIVFGGLGVRVFDASRGYALNRTSPE